MRSAALPLLALAISFALGCASNAPTPPSATEAALLLSAVNVADPAAAHQLIDGFYLLEQGAWRWTAKAFAVEFPTPPHVPRHPAQLTLQFTIPDVSIDTLGPLTLTTNVNGHQLLSRRYEQSGFRLTQAIEVPDEFLKETPTRVDFELDKALDQQTSSKFELGIIVESVSLQ